MLNTVIPRLGVLTTVISRLGVLTAVVPGLGVPATVVPGLGMLAAVVPGLGVLAVVVNDLGARRDLDRDALRERRVAHQAGDAGHGRGGDHRSGYQQFLHASSFRGTCFR
jgi:hypothetical protein